MSMNKSLQSIAEVENEEDMVNEQRSSTNFERATFSTIKHQQSHDTLSVKRPFALSPVSNLNDLVPMWEERGGPLKSPEHTRYILTLGVFRRNGHAHYPRAVNNTWLMSFCDSG